MLYLFTGNNAQAQFYGHFETRFQADNRLNGTSGFVEEYADIRLIDEQHGIDSALSLSLRQGDDNTANLYQFNFTKHLDGPIASFQLGRLNRADSLGFYSLDGIAAKSLDDNFLLTLYAGKSVRIDDYSSVHGEELYGFDFQFTDLWPDLSLHSISFDSAIARFGLQVLENDDQSTRLNWGFSSTGVVTGNELQKSGLDFNGVYLINDHTSEQVQIKIYHDKDEKNRIQFDYDTFSIDEAYLTIKDQFYSMYLTGRQTVITASYHYHPDEKSQWFTKGRTVIQERGDSGYGLSIGLRFREYSGDEYLGQLDYQLLNDDSFISLYTEKNYSLSPLTRSRFGIAIQNQDKWLDGNRQLTGIDIDLQHMLSSRLYFSFSVAGVWNSHSDDDYLIGLKLSYSFHEPRREWTNE